MSKAKIKAAKTALTKARNKAEAKPDNAEAAQAVTEAEAALAALAAPPAVPPAAPAVPTMHAPGEPSTGDDAEATAVAVEQLQVIVGELVKELKLQDGYELADNPGALQAQLREMQGIRRDREQAAALAAAAPKSGDYITLMSLTSARGVLPEGEIVKADDFGGKAALEENVERGLVEKVT